MDGKPTYQKRGGEGLSAAVKRNPEEGNEVRRPERRVSPCWMKSNPFAPQTERNKCGNTQAGKRGPPLLQKKEDVYGSGQRKGRSRLLSSDCKERIADKPVSSKGGRNGNCEVTEKKSRRKVLCRTRRRKKGGLTCGEVR